ncbi:MAG: hypothetical protein ACO1TE_29260 [Prosthecobacter sp.]
MQTLLTRLKRPLTLHCLLKHADSLMDLGVMLCVHLAFHNAWFTLAAALAVFSASVRQGALVMWLTARLSEHEADDEGSAPVMEHRRVTTHTPRPLGTVYRAEGDDDNLTRWTWPKIFFAILGLHVAITALYFIAVAVMGAEEPRW